MELEDVRVLSGDLKEAAAEICDGFSDRVIRRALKPHLLHLPLLRWRLGLNAGRRSRRRRRRLLQQLLRAGGCRGLRRQRRMSRDGGRREHRGWLEGREWGADGRFGDSPVWSRDGQREWGFGHGKVCFASLNYKIEYMTCSTTFKLGNFLP